MHGLVIKNTGSWYTVRTDEGLTVECKVKGNFRLKGIRTTNPVAIGDGVEIVRGADGHALISSIDDRKNYIIRKATNLSKQSHILAANIDQCMLIVTINYPETSTTFIDRFLANAEAYSIPAVRDERNWRNTPHSTEVWVTNVCRHQHKPMKAWRR